MTEISDLVIDEQCAAAIPQARETLIAEVTEVKVGNHLEAIADADRVVTHLFECLDRAYLGWRWAVTVARAANNDEITIDEVVLLPGPGSLLAPVWLPWEDRIKPGDLGVGDVLRSAPGDWRLTPGYAGTDIDDSQDDDLVPLGWELGLGRVRILSAQGRDEAAARWEGGDSGPRSPIAKAADEQCSTCGFLVAMAGPLGRAFGLCANEFSPADGRVVSLDHGCGAHSEAVVESVPVGVVDLVIDDLAPEELDVTPEPDDEPAVATDDEPAVATDDEPAVATDD